MQLSQNEARLYQRTWFPPSFKVRLASDLIPPQMAKQVANISHLISLEGAGLNVSFIPNSFTTENGDLRLGTIALMIIDEAAQTSDGVRVTVSLTVEFQILRDKQTIEAIFNEGIGKSLGATFANRCRFLTIGATAQLRYGDAIEQQDLIGTQVQQQLQQSVCGKPERSNEKLGLQISKVLVQVSGGDPRAGREKGEVPLEFDIANDARRLLHLFHTEPISREALAFVLTGLEIKAAHLRTHTLAHGTAPVILSGQDANALSNIGLGDFLGLLRPEADLIPVGKTRSELTQPEVETLRQQMIERFRGLPR